VQPRGKPHELKGVMPEIAQKGLHMASQAVQVNRTKSTELSKTISNEVDEKRNSGSRLRTLARAGLSYRITR